MYSDFISSYFIFDLEESELTMTLTFFFQVDVTRAMEKFFNNKLNNVSGQRPKRTLKLKRAEMYQLQTLREMSGQREEEKKKDEASPMSSETNT